MEIVESHDGSVPEMANTPAVPEMANTPAVPEVATTPAIDMAADPTAIVDAGELPLLAVDDLFSSDGEVEQPQKKKRKGRGGAAPAKPRRKQDNPTDIMPSGHKDCQREHKARSAYHRSQQQFSEPNL